MEIFIQSIDPGAWNAIVKGPCIPTKKVNSELVSKEWDEMKDDEKRKVQDDQKAKNILTSSYILMNSFVLQGEKVQRKYGKCLKLVMKAQRM